MMLPPIEDSVLQNNPKFAALHTTLSTSILNPSGSTKKHPAQKERDAVSEALKAARLRATRTQLIRDALSSIDLNPTTSPPPAPTTRPNRPPPTKQQPQPLPPALLELILLLSARLSSPTPSPIPLALTSSPLWTTTLPSSLPSIAALLSTTLHSSALALTRILSPTTNPSFLHRSIPTLLPTTQTLLSTIPTTKSTLASRRAALITTTAILLDAYHLATVLAIHALESVSCGAIHRHARARAELSALTATHTSFAAQEREGRAEKAVYTPEVRDALGNYAAALRDGRERLRERRKGAERALWGYGVGRDGEKERVMKEVARVYGELMREMEEVGRDVERLRGRRRR